ncbi:calcium-binding protein [Shimia marina]|uniref:Calcium-binding protein n=1 Tax=Shimia marina TaxID=321267 RepID=A0A0P1ELA8_9RHOB|nr:hypothetical protein [Shimia marina]CUH51114.1 hypothetical protein SHM7688_00547 [Shimia marina]SFD57743.1 hypothetical protein SAMN04488037_101556 [Shimia marina]
MTDLTKRLSTVPFVLRRAGRGLLCALIAVIMMAGLNTAQAQGTDGTASQPGAQTVYVYGNSLVHHLTETDETAAPHWMALLAQAAGTEFALDGQWGFLRDFANSGTPEANWRFAQVSRAWGRTYRNFADVPWDTVMITPANFIQYQAPERPYDGDNPDQASPVSATLAVMDRMQAELGPVRIAIYEGWADMGSQVRRFPPSARQLRKYHRFNAGEYHDWYDTYVAALRRARPEAQVDLIPVASVMAELLDGGVLDGLAAEVLYSDDAPHGTPTTYLLAGAITYVALFQSELPLEVDLPESIHADVRTYWEAVRDEIHRLVLKPAQAAAREVSPNTPFRTPPRDTSQLSSQGLAGVELAGLGLADPALAMGLSGISDWSTQQPFIDRMKTARPWVGHVEGQWGALSFEDLQDRGLVDETGWIWGLPEDIDSVESLLLTNQPEAATGLSGLYRVSWEGAGAVELTGRARVTQRGPNTLWFDFTPGEGHVGLKIREPDPERVGDYVRNITVIALPHIPLWEAGAVFNPDWLNVVDDLRMVRFMDWMDTNHSTQSRWEDRPLKSDFTYGWRGVPVEIMVRLANEIGADAWFTLPHLAEAAYITAFASYVRDHLDPELLTYAEYSNELWNWGFEQAQWALREGEARWGKGSDVQMQFAGMKAAEMAQLWGAAYGDQAAARLVRVIATHTGWPGYERGLLEAPLWQAEGNPAPVTQFDAYAVTGYFGVSLGLEEGAAQLQAWLAQARTVAEAEGAAQGLQRAALAAYVEAHQYDGVFAKAAEALRQGDVAEMLTEFMPYHAKKARELDLALVMYEGGSHVAGVGVQANDDTLTAFYTAFSASAELAEVYKDMLAAWRSLGGRSFNAFTDVGRPSKWGSWGHLRHLWDKTPRHDVLTAYNTAGPHWSTARAEHVFLHGGLYLGSEDADRLEGTGKRDILLGAGGNDVLVARGRGDLLHGGAGTDRAVLPGAQTDYAFSRDGARIRATAAGRSYLLTSIEAVAFESAPALVLPIGGLL